MNRGIVPPLTAAALALVLAGAAAVAGAAAEPRTPAVPAQAGGTASGQPATPPAGTGAIADATPGDVRQHLDRLEQIVESILSVAPDGEPIVAGREQATDEPTRVGTAGTPVTERTGETVVVERAKLEDLRVHVRQAREALRQVEAERRP